MQWTFWLPEIMDEFISSEVVQGNVLKSTKRPFKFSYP